ncbi:grasp-with-spasm system ATP-grasp peptide maturase [Fluviicola taffensis]|uniref:ATP-grasp domain-containing protein n=1 Tax=Fluviicola taffensis (strain DSM 16823 / NCIMB 13979 / RW262) TaxID=755732 RepID=F2IBL1_FLUTR|nr:grasp-with-spasm system ATP-grasp peptide maturase [Fluviicola taffensis]AEA45337.1 hypothetical protein Fluta_3365 [Fluviicola taffensis DSM 16823]
MKYLLFFSIEDDITTHRMVDWCISLNVTPIIIDTRNLSKVLLNYSIANNIFSFQIKHKRSIVTEKDVVGYIYRRSNASTLSNYKFSTLTPELEEFAQQEIISFNSGFFHALFKYMKGVNNLNTAINDKLETLFLAQESGFKIPDSHLLTSNEEAIKIIKKTGKRYITKPIYNMVMLRHNSNHYMQYTTEVKSKHFNKESEVFPFLLQERIEKSFEIRTFFLNEKAFSMAIFSQEDKQTSEDFRRYNTVHPNRTVPFELKKEDLLKLKKLMKSLNLNSGSIDFLKSETGELYFLEVNPVGQFGMVSGPCNYYLEREVVTNLVSNEKIN